ncbi:hypothetical protein ACFO25_04240 [Paenactinomyces guangxiensis]|uniref:Uncharacterized protein n=1 Tax=Paenactinomyces guangxiensis TaxID=1490290 RepID=A0A7W1WPL1_9BACL|nr:hypothetical protein [Paenactinomyces guangxiensis]MBA4493588.1 hypothetical protein [Paenactinomyces guangxiensis]MBH8590875.1 hypothetical protein [Paenactinomyces guangxiensis]
MDQQKKQLVFIILKMLKDIYEKTQKLEIMFQSRSIHLISRHFDPFNDLMEALQVPKEKNTYFLELMKLYIEDEMTLDEIMLEIEQQVGNSN